MAARQAPSLAIASMLRLYVASVLRFVVNRLRICVTASLSTSALISCGQSGPLPDAAGAAAGSGAEAGVSAGVPTAGGGISAVGGWSPRAAICGAEVLLSAATTSG